MFMNLTLLLLLMDYLALMHSTEARVLTGLPLPAQAQIGFEALRLCDDADLKELGNGYYPLGRRLRVQRDITTTV